MNLYNGAICLRQQNVGKSGRFRGKHWAWRTRRSCYVVNFAVQIAPSSDTFHFLLRTSDLSLRSGIEIDCCDIDGCYVSDDVAVCVTCRFVAFSRGLIFRCAAEITPLPHTTSLSLLRIHARIFKLRIPFSSCVDFVTAAFFGNQGTGSTPKSTARPPDCVEYI